jgi:hypothetical protein
MDIGLPVLLLGMLIVVLAVYSLARVAGRGFKRGSR